MSFDGKVALVTGSSRGIGKAIALELASKGADVVVNFRRQRQLALDVVSQIRDMGRRSIALRTDISSHPRVVTMMQRIEKEFGRLDILVNNAAIVAFRRVEEMRDRDWDRTLKMNIKGVMWCIQEALAVMPNGGKIVSLTSFGTFTYIPRYGPIGACKAAIETITRTLAVELADRDINVNCVNGGPIATDSLAHFVEETKKWSNRTPQGRIGTPEDISHVVVFLCSDEANWVRGQSILVDGGMTII